MPKGGRRGGMRTRAIITGAGSGIGAAAAEALRGRGAQVVGLPFTVDELGFVSGPAEISLMAMGAPQPVPTEAAEHLLAVLYRRARAHSL